MMKLFGTGKRKWIKAIASVALLSFAYQVQAQGLLCERAFAGGTTLTPVSMTDLQNAFEQIDKAFAGQINEDNKSSYSEPYNAFFRPEIGFEGRQSWRSSATQLKLTQEQLESSWRSPLYLRPMEMALFKGVLFPSAYFVRRTSFGNGLRRMVPINFPSFGREMPYAIVRGANVETHGTGGSKKLFEIWAEDHASSDGFVSLHRAAAKSEYQILELIRDLKTRDQSKPAAAQELEVIKTVAKALGDSGYENERALLDDLVHDAGLAARRDLISKLIESLGFFSGGIFTTDNPAAAKSFKGDGVDKVILSYKVPLAALQRLVDSSEVYFGVEYDYVEVAFIDNRQDQRAKKLLLDSLVSAE